VSERERERETYASDGEKVLVRIEGDRRNDRSLLWAE